MPEQGKPESTLMLWLEEALPGWILPVGGIGAVLALVLLYAADMISERVTAVIVVTAFASVVGYVHLVPAAQNVTQSAARGVVYAATALAVGLTVYSFRLAAFPGDPAAMGALSMQNKVLTLPAPGSYRLLVSGQLGGVGESKGKYELKVSGRADTVDDSLERTLVRRSFRKGGSVTTTQDRMQKYHSVEVAAPAQVELVRLGSEFKGTLNVAAFPSPPHWLFAGLLILTLLGTAATDALAAAKGRCALIGGSAATFGLLQVTQVTPDRLAQPTVGAVLLGVVVGALWSVIASRIARAALPAVWTQRGAKPTKEKEKKKERSAEAKSGA